MKLKSFLLALGLLTFAFACNNAGQEGQSTDEGSAGNDRRNQLC
jgi:hypothetical protein